MGPERRAEGRRESVRQLCGLLRCSEDELFLLAYRQWYGRVPGRVELERFLCRYRNQGEIPFWLLGALRSFPELSSAKGRLRCRRDAPVGRILGVIIGCAPTLFILPCL